MLILVRQRTCQLNAVFITLIVSEDSVHVIFASFSIEFEEIGACEGQLSSTFQAQCCSQGPKRLLVAEKEPEVR